MTTKTQLLTLALSALVTLVAAAATSAPAQAQDVFQRAGLTGGDNIVGVAEVKSDGEISFMTKNPTMAGVRVVKGPEVVYAARCKRSGYRCEKVEGRTNAIFSTDKSEETGTIQANLEAQDVRWMNKPNADQKKKRAKAEAELLDALKSACAAGQDEVELKVAVRLTCKNVKAPLQASRLYPMSTPKLATYKLNCR